MSRQRHPYAHEWFRETAAQHPARAALDTGRGIVTYEELLLSTQAVAAAVAPASGPVVVFTADRTRMITSLVGLLSAGAAFVPLTPDLPDARLAERVTVAGPSCVLVDADLVERYAERVAPSGACARVLSFEEIPAGAEFTPPALEPDHFCYLYFTSGSTGVPKGIAGRLKAIDHFIRWEVQALGLQAGVRVSQLIAPTFDAFLRDVFVPLCAGGTVCVPPAERLLEGESLADWLEAQEINLVHCVPSLLRTLTPFLGAERFPRLRHVLLSGEALRPSDVATWYGTFGGRIQLVNLYGPTETTMTKFAHFVSADDQHKRSVSIGKPIPGAQAFVAGEDGMPTESVGEICIRTPYSSAGYYRRPDLTAEVFVRNPLGTDERDVVYRTGDIGMVLPDGNFELLGRRDSQVKLRGLRIDLGEIENATVATGLASEAAAVVREDEVGQVLCAYVVLQEGAHVSELRDALRNVLPASMIPSIFVEMERMPTLPNGKLDRASLPDPKQQFARAAAAAAALNPVEEIIAGVWCQLLRLPSVRREDSFFELGGHSLLAMQATSRIGKALDTDVPLRLILQSPRLGDLAEQVQQQLRSQAAAPPPLVRAAHGGRAPLSFAQQRLWFLQQLEPHGAAYNVPFAVRLAGALDVAALRAALTEVVRRHEVLRTTFPIVEGEPVQLIHPPQPVPVPVVDLRGHDAAWREHVAAELVAAEAAQPFDLSTGPLLRARLLRLSGQEHVLTLTMHHIVSDGWSMGVLVSEFTRLYEALRAGHSSPLEELPVQYADYSIWQRGWLQGEVLEAQLGYWREQLAGLERLELPADETRNAAGASRAGVVRLEVGGELTERLRALSRAEGVTLFMTLLAGYQLLLSRYAGQRDVAVGTAVAGRGRVEAEGLVGFFVNTLVLRANLSGDPSFRGLLGRVREAVLGAYAHQEVPFERLVEELAPGRDASHTSLFRAALGFENVPVPELSLSGLEVAAVSVDNREAKFDLTLTLSEVEGRLVGGIEYRTNLFGRQTVERMAAHLLNIYESVTADPHQNLSSVRMLGPSELEQLTAGWNDTATDYPAASCIHQLFERQAALTPDATALMYEDERVSYAELNGRANRLGRRLRRLGIGAESKVGVCLERSAEMVVALTGVLKAGGAYVPLDADYPKERLAYMLRDAEVGALITQRSLAGALPDYDGPTIVIDSETDEAGDESAENFDAGIDPENLAYVVYTSGSTGKPKGVGVTHRAVVRLVRETDYVNLVSSDRVAQASNASFDAATFEVWGALLNGAALVGVSRDVALSARQLAALVGGRGVTTMFLTTALFNLIAREEPRAFAGMKQLLFGGELVDVTRVRELLRGGHAPERLLHVYGPTESTTFATWHLVTEVADGAVTVPIGRPLANTETYILDGDMNPIPVGVYGELYIGGDGLARGYENRPALTAERFVPHPYGRAAGRRLYRTGDIARYTTDGAIEFLGRWDKQVKVRGFRVELGEIEAVLNEHGAFGQCVAVARDAADGGKRVVAYVAHGGAPAPGNGELRRYLKDRLPEYMVPSAIVQLSELPLTPNGKVDQAALPEPEQAGLDEEGLHVAPRTPREAAVAGIWTELLGLERVGPHDNFFDLGGHSLLATQFASRARAAFNIELPLRAVFENPTLSGISSVIAAQEAQTAGQTWPTFLPVSVADGELEALLDEVEQEDEGETPVVAGAQPVEED